MIELPPSASPLCFIIKDVFDYIFNDNPRQFNATELSSMLYTFDKHAITYLTVLIGYWSMLRFSSEVLHSVEILI